MSNIAKVKVPTLENYSSTEAKLYAIVGCLQRIIEAAGGDIERLTPEDINGFDERVLALIDEQDTSS